MLPAILEDQPIEERYRLEGCAEQKHSTHDTKRDTSIQDAPEEIEVDDLEIVEEKSTPATRTTLSRSIPETQAIGMRDALVIEEVPMVHVPIVPQGSPHNKASRSAALANILTTNENVAGKKRKAEESHLQRQALPESKKARSDDPPLASS